MSADLHCHTKLSDGSMGIEDIVILAKKQGLGTIAITDHDCMAGNIRAKVIGDRHNVNVIHGVEISSTDSETQEEVHLLCYMSDSPDRLEGLCHRNLVARKKAAQYMMLKTAQRYPITPDLVLKCAQGSTNVYTVHIMAALVESGIETSINCDLYRKLFGKTARSFVVRPTFEDSIEVLKAIHEAGGIAVLAHPGKYSSYAIMEKLVDAGIDGIEVWTPEHDEEQTAYLAAYAKKKKLLSVGGSDFHGRFNTNRVTLGSYQTPDKQLSELISYKARLKRKQKQAAAAAAATTE
ncbi:MAG: PHP domain-containing protein [Clostridia bacterium]|nr:PHP domain-containing protein [Clostridia bacterium]